MISITNLSKRFGDQTLFADASIQFRAGERYGVVGANGSGKSTLLRIVSGEELPNAGEVAIPKRAVIGVLKQDHFRCETERILDVVMMGNTALWRAMVEKEALLAQAEQNFDTERYAELEDIVLREDGYRFEARAGEILEGLGIPTERHVEPLSALSGGFKLRVLLAQVLAADPDLLLLDEPTNHLDILSIRWLERFLESFTGCTLVVSHDHRFLDNVATQIVDVDYETLTVYPGNYRDFTRAKREERDRREKEIDKRSKEIAEHRAFVERFRAKATKARQAQSKLKQMARIEIGTLPQSSRRYPTFRFRQQRPSGRQVLTLDGISKRFGDQSVLEDVSLEVGRGERIAIIGPNGIGKSTLLKIAVGEVAADSGRVEWGYESHPGYFAQDHREQLGGADQSAENWLWTRCPGEPMGFVRGHLGAVLFSRDEVEKKIAALSGGEAARLIFARHIVEQPNVLVLDEPTNHLDLESIEALVEGLRAFPGTLIFVSHDRWFVGELASRVVEITPQGINDFGGTYAEYVARCGDDHLDSEAVLRAQRKARPARPLPPPKRGDAPADTRTLEAVTTALEDAEARIREIDQSFCDPGFFARTQREEVARLEGERRRLGEQVEALMREWETLEAGLTGS